MEPEYIDVTTDGREELKGFVAWCRKYHKRAFLGDVSEAIATSSGLSALADMLAAMEKDRDVWVGSTWWTAGPSAGEKPFTLEPKDGVDRPQLATLRPHLQPVPTLGKTRVGK